VIHNVSFHATLHPTISHIEKKGRSKEQIEALMQIGKICVNHLEHAYKVTLSATWDGSKRFLWKLQTFKLVNKDESYHLPLTENVLV